MLNLIMLGTGHATVTECYNTCFLLEATEGTIMVDAGGGNGILKQMKAARKVWSSIRALFVTHGHTDHVLGCLWVIRMIQAQQDRGKMQEDFHIYGLPENMEFLKNAAEFVLTRELGPKIIFHPVEDGDQFEACGMHFQVIDIHSTKKNQIGFRMEYQGTSVVCLGDEPFNEACREQATGADWLMAEAFCLYAEREKYHPYKICHSTALDAGKVAKELGAKHLVLYHTEDSDLQHRAENYGREAKESFDGEVFVPNDLERIQIIR